MKFCMTMEFETANLLVQFAEMCRDDFVKDGTPAVYRAQRNSPSAHLPSCLQLQR